MKHLKEFKLFEEVNITPDKKRELMQEIKKKLQYTVDKQISYEVDKNIHGYYDLKKLIEVVEENTELDLKKILDDLNKKLVNSPMPELTFKAITTGTAPIEALNYIEKNLTDTIKGILSNISWTKRKLIGAAMRLKHPSKASFIQNLKDPKLKDSDYAKESGYKFNYYKYKHGVTSILTSGASAFITKENYFISSDKKDPSRKKFNSFYDAIDAPDFDKKIEQSFDRILNIVWEGI